MIFARSIKSGCKAFLYKMKKAKTKHASVVTYTRPSVKAIKAACYEKPGQEFTVYSSIEGWFELRRVNKDGIRCAEFIRREDVRLSAGYLVTVTIEYLVTKLK